MKKINIVKKGKKHLSQSVFLFPSLFTIASMYCAFFSIASSVEGKLSRAALYIGFSIILDGLDGRIARALNAHTEIGLQLDSLADIIAFGVAPSILIYYWAFHPYYGGYYSKAGFLAAFLFLMCSAVRLAKFNIISTLTDKRFFIGLPTPASAGVIAALVHYYPQPLKASYASLTAIVLLIILSFLMVSKIKYFSFKSINLRSQKSYFYIIAIAVIIASILTFSQIALISLATIYLLSGIIMRLFGLQQKQPSPSAIIQEKKIGTPSSPHT
ncbi:MAG: CDP-diacylglycerol--serine O-phosphatidyltransferase [Candidatus Fischerbacteria bacterium RBG_13_37_8]|uniref:CDP-diacylglycerol--serine O-phosphatidyltransferase n=1 Tax=Candidatus Fischerbacteria bacterium RBG_13_37_8 TaxID=1817863 RepID=A0A1F5VRW7_9BACT|nr:MAG: CDP-diacylglycerol--serine O-phosphatidyltransferase [Candidatus Fischerbacteria bacterium RBG_13_37_8]